MLNCNRCRLFDVQTAVVLLFCLLKFLKAHFPIPSASFLVIHYQLFGCFLTLFILKQSLFRKQVAIYRKTTFRRYHHYARHTPSVRRILKTNGQTSSCKTES